MVPAKNRSLTGAALLAEACCDSEPTIEPFIDIMGRQFKQPREGLGYDNSPVAHMWRSTIRPDSPL